MTALIKHTVYSFIHLQSLPHPDQGHGGSEICFENTGCEVKQDTSVCHV